MASAHWASCCTCQVQILSMCATVTAEGFCSTETLPPNAEVGKCRRPTRLEQRDIPKSIWSSWSTCTATLVLFYTGGTFHPHLPVMHGAIHIWRGRACSVQGQAWEDTTCSPQLYLKGKPLVLRASQRQCQAVGVKISTGNHSVTTACTGKNRRRPTIQTWNPEPLCDSISHNERYTKPKGRQTTSIVIL